MTPFPRQIKWLSVTQKVAVNSTKVLSALTEKSGSVGSSDSLADLNAAKLLVANTKMKIW